MGIEACKSFLRIYYKYIASAQRKPDDVPRLRVITRLML